jgi:PAS domain S-box-containing protein
MPRTILDEAGVPSWQEEVVRHGERYCRRLLEKLPAGAYTCDSQGLITYFNPEAVKLWGREPKLNDPVDRFCGSFKLFVPDGSAIHHDQCWMALALRDNRAYNGCEIHVERPDGHRVVARAYANPFHDDSGQLLVAVNVLVDITEHQRLEQELRQANEERAIQLADLTRLHELCVRLSTTLELQPILDAFLREALTIAGTDMGLLSLCDPQRDGLHYRASIGLPEEFLKFVQFIPPGGGACGTSFVERRRVVVEDVETDPVFADYVEAARRIREQPWGKRIALIATTGWGQEADRRRSHEAGFDNHLVKPVDPAILSQMLESMSRVVRDEDGAHV